MPQLLQKCDQCGALVDEEDLFCANCGTEVPHEAAEGSPGDGTPDSARPQTRKSTHNFTCDGCGASMSYDPTAKTLACPFCGGTKLSQQKDAKVLAPSRVVPFALDRAAAEVKLREWLSQGTWKPGDLAEKAVITKMQAVYVPYWVFQANMHTYWTADSSNTPITARGDWVPMSGEQHNQYSGVLVGASGVLTPAETHAICPFDLNSAVPAEQVDLDHATVEQFGVQRKYARPLARQAFEQFECESCQRYVPGRCRNMKVNLLIENQSSEPMLLPVWVMAYRYKEDVFRFLMNGQTGKFTGRKPMSWQKIGMAIGITVGVIILLILMVIICGGLVSATG